MVMQAIEKYSGEDNFVNVFHKAFRNEVEEDFWLVQKELNRSIKDLAMVQLMGRFPTKDQSTLHAMLEKKLEGILGEDEWNDMVNYLYNNSDATAICLILKRLAREYMIEEGLIPGDDLSASMGSLQVSGGTGTGCPSKASLQRSSSAGRNTPSRGYTAFLNTSVQGSTSGGTAGGGSSADSKRLGYNSSTLRARLGGSQSGKLGSKSPDVSKLTKVPLRLPFPSFMKCVMDFQLRSHIQYLSTFKTAFKRCDADADGILSAEEFHECFQILRKGQIPRYTDGGGMSESKDDLDTFRTLLQIVDPHESDRITFSTAASILNKVANSDV